MNATRSIIGSYLIIRGSSSFPSVRANILSVIAASRFLCLVRLLVTLSFEIATSSRRRVVVLFIVVYAFSRGGANI